MIDWNSVWRATADELRDHQLRGRAHLLTEDVLRFAMVRHLEAHGITPSRMKLEHREAGIGPVDLVIDAPLGTMVEIKFPRDQDSGPITMTFGELLNDLYRLARCPSREAVAVQVIGPRLRRYLAAPSRGVSLGMQIHATTILPNDLPDRLPKTTRDAIKNHRGTAAIATCIHAEPVGDWQLLAYKVRSADRASARTVV